MTIPVPQFALGDHVRVLPLDGVKARVISVMWEMEGLRYQVRYFDNGDAKVFYVFADELEAA